MYLYVYVHPVVELRLVNCGRSVMGRHHHVLADIGLLRGNCPEVKD